MKKLFIAALAVLSFFYSISQQRPDSNTLLQVKDIARMFRQIKKPGTDSVFSIIVIIPGDTTWNFGYIASGSSGSGSTDWATITNKPATFIPSSHAHTVTDVTSLQSNLDAKANATHIHAVADINSLQSLLDAKQAAGSYANTAHTHVPADIIGLPGGSDPFTYITLSLNNTVSTTTYANVTGLSFTASANTKYLVRLTGTYQTAATTTGIGLALDIPSGTITGQIIVNISATANNTLEQIADATATGVATAVRAANTNSPISGWWLVSVGATGGNIQLLQRSEVAASNTVLQAGLTILEYRTIL